MTTLYHTEYTYNGFTLRVPITDEMPVEVRDPRFPARPALYKTTSLDMAARWIEAYQAGAMWAVDAMLPA